MKMLLLSELLLFVVVLLRSQCLSFELNQRYWPDTCVSITSCNAIISQCVDSFNTFHCLGSTSCSDCVRQLSSSSSSVCDACLADLSNIAPLYTGSVEMSRVPDM